MRSVFTIWLFVKRVIDSILFIGAVPFFLNGTYNGYTLIMYFTDDNTRNPMTLNSSFAENWCSSIGATLPRITDDAEQKNIVDFIRSATQKYELDRIKRIFVNNIYHTVGNWTWLNGRRNHGNFMFYCHDHLKTRTLRMSIHWLTSLIQFNNNYLNSDGQMR